MSLNGEKLAGGMFMKTKIPKGLSAPAPGLYTCILL